MIDVETGGVFAGKNSVRTFLIGRQLRSVREVCRDRNDVAEPATDNG